MIFPKIAAQGNNGLRITPLGKLIIGKVQLVNNHPFYRGQKGKDGGDKLDSCTDDAPPRLCAESISGFLRELVGCTYV